jgi:hypothetical protein
MSDDDIKSDDPDAFMRTPNEQPTYAQRCAMERLVRDNVRNLSHATAEQVEIALMRLGKDPGTKETVGPTLALRIAKRIREGIAKQRRQK